MTKKQILIWGIGIAILGALIFTEVRTWVFNWRAFRAQTAEINGGTVLLGILLIYATYFLRAVRWKIFLRPVCDVSARRLVAPTVIGFTGLALLGRAGEFIRPYLIARKERLSITSQIGVWTVERIFDLGGYTVLAVVNIFTAKDLPHTTVTIGSFPIEIVTLVGIVLIGLVAGLSVGAYYMRRRGVAVASWLERHLQAFSPKFAIHVAAKARAFSEGLNTIHDASAFLQLAGTSLAIWFSVTLAYLQVAHAYPALTQVPYSKLMLLVGFSMVGGLVQLPVIGGGSQLLTIGGLVFFDVPKELAISCGILLWLVTFVAVTPIGLALARREHVSIRRLSEQGHAEEQKEEEAQTGAPVRPQPEA